jgi:hypothetical protein
VKKINALTKEVEDFEVLRILKAVSQKSLKQLEILKSSQKCVI